MLDPQPASGMPVLYSFRRCPYAMRARLALLISGTACELREVKLSAKPQAMLDVSPKGTVPVLVVPDGTVINESTEIMRWALGQHDPAGWLAYDDPDLVARNDGSFKRDLDRYKYPERHSSDASRHRELGLGFLCDLEARLERTDQLCGAQVGFADMAIMPFVRQFAAVDSTWFKGLPLPRLQRWLADHLASALFACAMVRRPPWSPGEPVVGLIAHPSDNDSL